MPETLRKELAGVCKACFSTSPATKHAQVVAQYRQQFVSQLNPEAPAFPVTLGELAGAHPLRRIQSPHSLGYIEQAWYPSPWTAIIIWRGYRGSPARSCHPGTTAALLWPPSAVTPHQLAVQSRASAAARAWCVETFPGILGLGPEPGCALVRRALEDMAGHPAVNGGGNNAQLPAPRGRVPQPLGKFLIS